MASSNIFLIVALLSAAAGAKLEKPLLEPIDINWEAPKDFKNRFLYYHSGFDYDYKPVIVLELGHWDYQGAAEKGGEDLATANLFMDQLNTRLLAGYFHEQFNKTDSNDPDNEFVAIVDFDGIKLNQLKSPETLKFMLHRLSQMGSVYKTLSYGFILNANPLVHQMINAVKPFIGNFLEKVEVYGTNAKLWRSHLLKKIPPSELHPRYGGDNDFRPIAVYG